MEFFSQCPKIAETAMQEEADADLMVENDIQHVSEINWVYWNCKEIGYPYQDGLAERN